MKRLEKETIEDYRVRRKLSQSETKSKLKGKWFWKSKVVFFNIDDQLKYMKFGSNKFQDNGTYLRPKKEVKTSFTENLRNSKGYGNHLSKGIFRT